jgi:hypothetical protein
MPVSSVAVAALPAIGSVIPATLRHWAGWTARHGEYRLGTRTARCSPLWTGSAGRGGHSSAAVSVLRRAVRRQRRRVRHLAGTCRRSTPPPGADRPARPRPWLSSWPASSSAPAPRPTVPARRSCAPTMPCPESPDLFRRHPGTPRGGTPVRTPRPQHQPVRVLAGAARRAGDHDPQQRTGAHHCAAPSATAPTSARGTPASTRP